MSDKEKPDLVKASFENDYQKMLTLLKQGVDPNQQDEDGNTALHFAVLHSNIDAVDILLGFNANPNIKNKANVYPIMNVFGTPYERKAVVTLLKHGAYLSLIDKNKIPTTNDTILKDLLSGELDPSSFDYLYLAENNEPERPGSPRTEYSKATRENNIIMVGGVKDSLFQLRLSEPDKLFRKYKSLSSSIGINDCAYQTLFSLGLINRDYALFGSKSIETAQQKNRGLSIGTKHSDWMRQLYLIFGLSSGTLYISSNRDYKKDSTPREKYVTSLELQDFLLHNLDINCATIIILQRTIIIAHLVVGYKTESGVYIFDPQITRRKNGSPSIYPVANMEDQFGKCIAFSFLRFNKDVEEKTIQQEHCSFIMKPNIKKLDIEKPDLVKPDIEKPDLVKASFENDYQKMLTLLKQGVDPNQQDEDGNTALHFAVLNGNRDGIDVLLGVFRANPNIKNKANVYPIMNVFGKPYVRTAVVTLLKHGADLSLIDKNKIPTTNDTILKDLLSGKLNASKIDYRYLTEINVPERPGSPRTEYSKATRENNIIMVGGVKDSLFQLRLSEPDKLFRKYKSLSYSLGIHDCAYQTLFSLGLINRDYALYGSKSIETAQKNNHKLWYGIEHNNWIRQLHLIFGLSNGTLYFSSNYDYEKNITPREKNITSLELHVFLLHNLDINCATIIILHTSITTGHVVVGYKTESDVYIFDPQRTRDGTSSIYPARYMEPYFGKCIAFSFLRFNKDVEEKTIQQEHCSFIMDIKNFGGKKTKKKKSVNKRNTFCKNSSCKKRKTKQRNKSFYRH